ncbi:hypothetical protein [Modestobacter altitudinis]|uniref:hypothetical protein n=1 Tax=Modestobacter altitudinis TaxID=2213158 RepID=UPI00110CA99C|nr:hypothetical protein [Modestobacter altitudinis]
MTAGEHDGVAVAGRVAAVAGAVCVAVHLVTATSGGHGGAVERVVFVAMAVACLPCVRALWQRPVRGVWQATAVMYGGMAFLHLLLLSAASGGSGHLAGGSPVHAGADVGMWGGLLLAALQVALAGTVLASGRLREQEDPVRVPAG